MPSIVIYLLVIVAIGFVSFLVSDFLTGKSIQFAIKRNLVAHPNSRSSHQIPTPRVGGIGIMAGLMVGLGLVALMVGIPDRMPRALQLSDGAFNWLKLGGMTLALLLAFAIGFWDDRHDTPALFKLIGQVAIAIIPPVAGLQLTHLQIPYVGDVAFHPIVSILVTALWILIVMNTVNFMDGINGLAGRFAQIVGFTALLATFTYAGGEILIPLGAALVGANIGFLDYNFPKAKTFMGDCGSQPLGVYVALLGIIVAGSPFSYPIPFLGFIIVVSPFLFDVLYTLIRRAIQGENVFVAHREHLYQRYHIATGEDHSKTFRFVEVYLYISAVLGGLYMAFLFHESKALWQAVFIAAAVAALFHYARRVRAVESSSTPQPVISSPPAPTGEE